MNQLADSRFCVNLCKIFDDLNMLISAIAINFFAKPPAAYFSTKYYFLILTAPPGWWWVGKREKTDDGCAASSYPWQFRNKLMKLKCWNIRTGYQDSVQFSSRYVLVSVVFEKLCGLDWIIFTSFKNYLNEHILHGFKKGKWGVPIDVTRRFEELAMRQKYCKKYAK